MQAFYKDVSKNINGSVALKKAKSEQRQFSSLERLQRKEEFTDVLASKLLRSINKSVIKSQQDKGILKDNNDPRWEIKITKKDLKDQMLKQNNKCFYTGVPLKSCYNSKHLSRHPLAISVDRIDNNKGYILGNFVFTLRGINLMRSNTPIEEFKKRFGLFARIIFDNYKIPLNISDCLE
jgi:hypothetical protein